MYEKHQIQINSLMLPIKLVPKLLQLLLNTLVAYQKVIANSHICVAVSGNAGDSLLITILTDES